LLPDELLSSWLVRAALAQGCDPLVLSGNIWPKWRPWLVDLDRRLTEQRLSSLAKATGVSAKSFEAANLRQIAFAVTPDAAFDEMATWPWVLALGSRNRRRRGGLQYCPSCFDEDRRPYFRIQWRLAWHTACPFHSEVLRDRCPHCASSVEPHRLVATDADMAICATCKGDLRDAAHLACGADALAFQDAADLVVKDHQGVYGSIPTPIPVAEWFALARYFSALLRKAPLNPSGRMAGLVQALGVDLPTIVPTATGLGLEVLPVGERLMLLSGVQRMLACGPNQFVSAAKMLSLTSTALIDRRRPIAPVVDALIEQLPGCGRVRANGQPLGLAPRSRIAVSRMWARLQRRMLVVKP
jgi:hypothetical protein